MPPKTPKNTVLQQKGRKTLLLYEEWDVMSKMVTGIPSKLFGLIGKGRKRKCTTYFILSTLEFRDFRRTFDNIV